MENIIPLFSVTKISSLMYPKFSYLPAAEWDWVLFGFTRVSKCNTQIGEKLLKLSKQSITINPKVIVRTPERGLGFPGG